MLKQSKDASGLSRQQLLRQLQEDHFDILIIGGGASGAGAALDAASRGLRVALIEAQDFSSGTSSRSTKLVHGGVRYLENAVKRLDKKDYDLVHDALKERKIFLKNAPHLSHPLPIITPVYSLWEAAYYWTGLKFYDFVAGSAVLGSSEFLSKEQTIARFPMLKTKGLRGAILYYDGQFDDARMNLALILSALKQGAVALNYVRAVNLSKAGKKLIGASVCDQETNETFLVRAKVIINATGVFADTIRKMDDIDAPSIMMSSQGSHLLLPAHFSPPGEGLIIPKTKDGRVLFLLPWQGRAVAGTTDHPADITSSPQALDEEVEYILGHLRAYLNMPVNRSDIIATFSGLRPLLKPSAHVTDTALVSRDHLIEISQAGLVTIVGGKWTTYRKMAEDVVNAAIKSGELKPENACLTHDHVLVGGHHFGEHLAHELASKENLAPDIAQHLVKSYGDQCDRVMAIEHGSRSRRLSPHFPYIEAEVIYAVSHEHARHATDVIARRLRLAFLDNAAALGVLPRVIALMSEVLGWTKAQEEQELQSGKEFLETMHTI